MNNKIRITVYLFKTTKQRITNRIKKYYLFITQFLSTYKQHVSYYASVLLGLESSIINEGVLLVASEIIIRDKDDITIMEKHLNVSLINVENGEPIKLTTFLITTSCKNNDLYVYNRYILAIFFLVYLLFWNRLIRICLPRIISSNFTFFLFILLLNIF